VVTPRNGGFLPRAYVLPYFRLVSEFGRKNTDNSPLLIFYALRRFISITIAKYLCLFSQLK
jgi:hypothetical protein